MEKSAKIPCNGIKPTKAMIYTLAAELVESQIESERIKSFKDAIIAAMKMHDYDYYDDYYNYYYYDYYSYDYDYYYDGYYYDGYYTQEQKVIALLFLAAMYS